MSTYQEMTKMIQDGFLELYDSMSVHQMTVKGLCEHIGIPRTSFYNYYSDLFEVLESIEDYLIFDLKQLNMDFAKINFHDCDKEQFVYFYKTLQYISDHQNWFRVLMNKSRDGRFIYKWKKIIKEDFSEKYASENIVLENEPLKLEMIASGCIGAYIYWINNADIVSMEIVAKEVLYDLCQDFIH